MSRSFRIGTDSAEHLAVEVLAREHPDKSDYWDGNWLTATIASGHGSRPNDDVRKVTGSPPASFTDFAHRNARAWAVPAAHP